MSNSVACGDSKDVGGVQERSTACGEHEGKDEKRKRAMVCGGFEDGNGNGKRSMACGEYPGWTEGRGGDIPTIQVDAPVMVTVTSTMTISCLKPTAIA
ncbi:hypothetical protein EMCG_05826 [[Emmonsia] crescens]|uniref:Uncharacterized protein n=1 Tax=[Emmonsia] crescens TaxID=73230 RepID=A0A0G2IE28_9EURO|nr:hypothetical protein EMCG_05826 [Emmonsia crescens UAMH 3008]